MPHYPSSFMVVGTPSHYTRCIWNSGMAGAPGANTEGTAAYSFPQICVQCLDISHFLAALVGIFTQWKLANYKLTFPAQSRLTITQHNMAYTPEPN